MPAPLHRIVTIQYTKAKTNNNDQLLFFCLFFSFRNVTQTDLIMRASFFFHLPRFDLVESIYYNSLHVSLCFIFHFAMTMWFCFVSDFAWMLFFSLSSNNVAAPLLLLLLFSSFISYRSYFIRNSDNVIGRSLLYYMRPLIQTYTHTHTHIMCICNWIYKYSATFTTYCEPNAKEENLFNLCSYEAN